MTMWTQPEALAFCRILESVAPAYGAHVALTGGLLYKDGARKDCDVVLYRIRHRKEPVAWDALFGALIPYGVQFVHDYGWCKKITWNGKPVDVFDPDNTGEYPDEKAEVIDESKPVAGVDDFSQFTPVLETA